MKTTTVARIRRWGKVGSAISGALVTIIAPVWLMVRDAQGTAEAAQKGAASGYETLAPAVVENQKNLKTGMDALALLAKEVEEFSTHKEAEAAAHALLQKRIMRCEVYIEVISSGRFHPASEPIPEAPVTPIEAAAASMAALSDALETKPQEVAEKINKRKKLPVPESLNKAQTYQNKRKSMKCEKGDPLCGS